MTAAVNSGVSFGCRRPWASIHTFTKSAPLATISSTLARPSSGVFASEPGLNGSDMKREDARAAQVTRLLPGLELGDVVLIEIHAGRGGHAIERVLAQLRIARGRTDMAVAVDDAGHHEFAGEIDDRGVRGSREARPDLADAALLHHDGDVALRRRAGSIDQRRVGQDDGLRVGRRPEQNHRREYDRCLCAHYQPSPQAFLAAKLR